MTFDPRRQSLPFRQGFLVKKTRKGWKSRWFLLQEDRLSYYGKTSRQDALGCIQLRGAALISPVPEYKNHKRKEVFKLVVEEGKDCLLQAQTQEDREVWIHAISGVIRAQSASAPTCPDGRHLDTKHNLSDILGAMQDPDAGVKRCCTDTEGTEGADHQSCFNGNHGVDWILSWSFAGDRAEAAALLAELLRIGHIQMARVPGKKKSEVTPEKENNVFYDTPDVHYKFSSVTRGPTLSMVFGSSSDSSESSEGEESEGDMLESTKKAHKKGKVTKEGFLMKRGYYRKKWKLRKVVLRENPPSLEYYSASKGADKTWLKFLSLLGVSVLDIEDKHKDSDSSKKKCLFCLQKGQGKVAVFQAEDKYRKAEWLAALRGLCPEPPDTQQPAAANTT